jgi:predicted nucleic acid-binding protein
MQSRGRVVAVGAAFRSFIATRRGAVVDLLDLPLRRYRHDALVPRIWELRENFSAYDSAYLALAEVISDDGVPLLTAERDRRTSTAAG